MIYRCISSKYTTCVMTSVFELNKTSLKGGLWHLLCGGCFFSVYVAQWTSGFLLFYNILDCWKSSGRCLCSASDCFSLSSHIPNDFFSRKQIFELFNNKYGLHSQNPRFIRVIWSYLLFEPSVSQDTLCQSLVPVLSEKLFQLSEKYSALN